MLTDNIGPIGPDPAAWFRLVVVALGFMFLGAVAGWAARGLSLEQRRENRADERERAQLADTLNGHPLPPAGSAGAYHRADDVDLPDEAVQVIELDGPTVAVGGEWWYRALLRRTGRAGGA